MQQLWFLLLLRRCWQQTVMVRLLLELQFLLVRR
jgi:hypothetical protein